MDQAIGTAGRAGAIVRHAHSAFLVPNERIQEEAGQRQNRTGGETLGQFSYQQIVSPVMLWDVRGMTRTLSATLASNVESTPIRAQQDRGLKEGYVKAAVTGHHGAHEWKAGGDADFSNVREEFGYDITDPDQFARGTPRTFAFSGRANDREQALFVQDRIAMGRWTWSAGLRWDRYAFLVNDHALSPRLAAAWSMPEHTLVARASFDRAFQTPSVENLLLASSPSVESLSPEAVRLPVPPSRGNFYEAGVTKGLFRKMRLDVTAYRRLIDDFADDDVLLNTGVTFPVAFRKADIRGSEVKLDMPSWGHFSGFLSYALMTGYGYLPVEGGLLLGDEIEALESIDRFVVTQDQRHTIGSRIAYQAGRSSLALSVSYGSGLPVEFDDSKEEAIEQFGARVVNRVNLDEGRVRPSLALDASLSHTFGESRPLRVQADLINLTNQLHVINFAGVFSGTAIAAPRSVALRATVTF